MDTSLTNTEAVAYLLSVRNKNGDKMPGTIRTKEKCPKCNKPFEHIEEIGFICKEHLTVPKRFFIDVYFGKQVKIYSHKSGLILSSYELAVETLKHIQYEIRNKTFDPSKYLKAEIEQFLVGTLLERFQVDKLPSIAPSWKKHYKRYSDLAKEFFKIKDIRDLRKIDIVDFKKHLIEKYYSEQPKQGKTLKNVLDHFKTFLIHCMKEYEVIDKVPSFPQIEVQTYQFKWLGQEDQISLFGFVEEQHKPFVAFLMLHGCRPGEARALKCKNVDLKQQTITITATFSRETYKERRKGRGAKQVIVPIHPELYDFITLRVKNNLPEAFVFANKKGGYYTENNIFRLWEKTRKAAKIEKGLRLYDVTRHSFASQLINSNVTLYKVSRLLGHSTTKMTEKYAHHDIEKLKTDLEKLTLKSKQAIVKTL